MSEILDGKYILGKELGRGQFSKVRVGKDLAGNQYAIKIINKQQTKMDEKFMELLNSEIKTLQAIHHPNIVNLIDYSDHGKVLISLPTPREVDVIYMVLELVPNGELFDYVSTTGKFSESMCRLFFLEFMTVLNALHLQNICHRDLKPENIMLDDKFKVKVLDFGFSIPASGRDGSGILHSYLGTKLYMAPEIHACMPYDGKSVDLFAAGVILFILYAGHPPFAAATLIDTLYRLIASKNNVHFWTFHCNRKPPGYYTEDFKSLINHMLAYDPKDRYSMEMILNHPWCKGTTATEPERAAEFSNRLNVIKTKNSAITAPTAVSKPSGVFRGSNKGVVKGLSDDEYEKLMTEDMKELYLYEEGGKDLISFMSNEHPNIINEVIKSVLIGMNPRNINVDSKKYKITASIDGAIGSVDMKFKICKVKDQIYYVEVKKQKGDKTDYLEMIEKIFAKGAGVEELKNY